MSRYSYWYLLFSKIVRMAGDVQAHHMELNMLTLNIFEFKKLAKPFNHCLPENKYSIFVSVGLLIY